MRRAQALPQKPENIDATMPSRRAIMLASRHRARQPSETMTVQPVEIRSSRQRSTEPAPRLL
jgi:4'-phosphopantetheinyl transferase EntD